MAESMDHSGESGRFAERRARLRDYFDGSATEAWARLTSDAPVSRIRETVRAGRGEMRATLLSWAQAPDGASLADARLLDAGCGSGALAIEAAAAGAQVVAVDIAAKLVRLAEERTPAALRSRIDYRVGDMSGAAPTGDAPAFDAVIAMDSLIHYRRADMVDALGRLAAQARRTVLFTFAPRTPALTMMHAAGRAFPRSDRAPEIEPVGEGRLRGAIEAAPGLAGWRIGRTKRISRGFYTSQAMELIRP